MSFGWFLPVIPHIYCVGGLWCSAKYIYACPPSLIFRILRAGVVKGRDDALWFLSEPCLPSAQDWCKTLQHCNKLAAEPSTWPWVLCSFSIRHSLNQVFVLGNSVLGISRDSQNQVWQHMLGRLLVLRWGREGSGDFLTGFHSYFTVHCLHAFLKQPVYLLSFDLCCLVFPSIPCPEWHSQRGKKKWQQSQAAI